MIGHLRDSATYLKAKHRLGKVPPAQRQAWAQSALWGVQAMLEEHQRTGYVEALGQAREGTVQLLAAIDSLVDNAK